MQIVRITESNVDIAGKIHAESWQDSHKSFCSEEFVARHTAQAQASYIRAQIAAGKDFYMLIDQEPVGIVSVQDNLIENLYVLPNEQRKGYGSMLLQHALDCCSGVLSLWILSNNNRAYAFYKKHGFRESGNKKQLRDDLFEVEMIRGTQNGL